ncbi:unnamed protein product [Leptosia nina]|uniref:Uncharacterized protein n=1 Tax=Leptosia nina TaxID=320188 RepID=A0AAV1JPP1_9NEOP
MDIVLEATHCRSNWLDKRAILRECRHTLWTPAQDLSIILLRPGMMSWSKQREKLHICSDELTDLGIHFL